MIVCARCGRVSGAKSSQVHYYDQRPSQQAAGQLARQHASQQCTDACVFRLVHYLHCAQLRASFRTDRSAVPPSQCAIKASSWSMCNHTLVASRRLFC